MAVSVHQSPAEEQLVSLRALDLCNSVCYKAAFIFKNVNILEIKGCDLSVVISQRNKTCNNRQTEIFL